MKSCLSHFAYALLPLLSFVSVAPASTILVGANHQGWVQSAGYGNGGDLANNVTTGNFYAFSGNVHINSWGGFDLSSITDTIVSAQLRLTTSAGFLDPPATQTIEFFDVSNPLSSFIATGDFSPGHGSLYTDLGSGNSYGTVDVAPSTLQVYTVTLNAQAIADLNAARGGEFSIGFTNVTMNGKPVDTYGAVSTGNDFRTLILETRPNITPVPEPTSIALLGVGGFSLILAARQRRRTIS